MNFSEYQLKSRITAIYPNIGTNIVYPTLGLCGETGEVAEKIKKIIGLFHVKESYYVKLSREYIEKIEGFGELGTLYELRENLNQLEKE